MKRLWGSLLLLGLAVPASAQIITQGTITTVSTNSNCAVAKSCVSVALTSNPSIVIQVSGTWTGTLTFEATADGNVWQTVSLVKASDGSLVTTTTANGQFASGNPGYISIRARATAAITGGANIVATHGRISWTSFGAGGSGSGTVTSVGVSFTGGLISVGSSPVTTSGTIALTVAGTSGGVPYFDSASTWASSGALTANLPVIGGGAGAAPAVGTRSGNTTKFVSTTGSLTTNNCAKWDASGNAVDAGTTCGGSGTTPQIRAAYVSKTGNYTLDLSTDGTVELLTNAGTFTLPTAVGVSGQAVIVKNLQTANALTLATTSAQTIDGASPGTVSNGCLTLVSDNANWRIAGACGLPLSSLTSGGVIYASSTTAVASSALLAANALVVGGGAGTAPATVTTGTGVLTALSNTANATGGVVTVDGTATLTNKTLTSPTLTTPVLGTPSSGTLNLVATNLFVAGVCQNTTASIGTSLFTSNTPTATCVTGSNTTFGSALFTATGQSLQGMIAITETPASTTFNVMCQYYGVGTSAGNNVFTFSYARVAAGSTLDPSWTDVDITDAAGTANQLNVCSTAVTISGLSKNDLLFWKFAYKTAATTPSNQGLITLSLLPVLAKPIGG